MRQGKRLNCVIYVLGNFVYGAWAFGTGLMQPAGFTSQNSE
jgi:hypothetical protein